MFELFLTVAVFHETGTFLCDAMRLVVVSVDSACTGSNRPLLISQGVMQRVLVESVVWLCSDNELIIHDVHAADETAAEVSHTLITVNAPLKPQNLKHNQQLLSTNSVDIQELCFMISAL